MLDELKPAEIETGAPLEQQISAKRASGQGGRTLGLLMLGSLVGAILAAAFLAYGQPELLLEQLNLRYCG